MKRMRWLALGIAVALGVGTMAATAGAQSSSSEKPTATDVGITDKEIHVAVIADVDNAIAPNLFKASPDAMAGFANYINSKAGGGGLAGRKLVVDFYDSKLNPTETRNAEIKACENDAAAVGTSAVFLTSVDDMRNCKDKTGAATGLPDIPFVSTAIVQQCSDQSFPIAPPQVDCTTVSQHPQTFHANVARGIYYQKKYGKDLHGVYIFGADSKSARDSSFASLGALRDIGGTDQGIKSDGDFNVSGRDPQSAYTPFVQQMKTSSSNYAQCTGGYACTVNLRKEAALQGVQAKVWDCGVSCYDKQFISAAGADAEGQYSDTLFLPFYNKADQKANPMLGNYVKYTGADKIASFGVYAWAAGVAFRDAVNAQVKAGGVNSVTRKTIFEQLNKIHTFDADGIMAPIDLAGRGISNCSVLSQVKNGQFVRVEPTKPGTFACPKGGSITRKLDLLGTS